MVIKIHYLLHILLDDLLVDAAALVDEMAGRRDRVDVKLLLRHVERSVASDERKE
jgi:hypothetical protein